MLKIIRFNPVEISDVLFHVLDYLDLLGMEVELSLYGRDFYLFPIRRKVRTHIPDGNTITRFDYPNFP